MSRNSDSYVNRNQNRNQSSNIKRPLPSNNNNDHHPYGNNNRDRHGPVNNGSNDRHRSSPVRRSRSNTNKTVPPKRNARPPAPKYICTLPKASLDR